MVLSSKQGRPCRVGSTKSVQYIEVTGQAGSDLPDALDPNTKEGNYDNWVEDAWSQVTALWV